MMKLIRLLVMAVAAVAAVAAAETVTAQEQGCTADMTCENTGTCLLGPSPFAPSGSEFVFHSRCCYGDPWDPSGSYGSVRCTSTTIYTGICCRGS